MHSFACEGESVMEAPILDRRPEFCKFTYHYLQGTVLGAHKNRSGRASFMSVAKNSLVLRRKDISACCSCTDLVFT